MITILPNATEKVYALSQKDTYAFKVNGKTSKQYIREAIEKEFKVTVTSIRVLVRKGKSKRFSRGKRAFPGTTTLANTKIAYVTLKAGDKIKMFEENVDEAKDAAPADAKTAAKELKKAEKANKGEKK